MNIQRWRELEADPSLKLTKEEVEQGWHFCRDFDGMVVGPDMQGEWDCCGCDYPGVRAIKGKYTKADHCQHGEPLSCPCLECDAVIFPDPNEVSIRRVNDGTMEVLLGDWVYVRVNYDFRYTDNGHTRLLAERIKALLVSDVKGQP